MFVADEISARSRRVIEFLNKQTDPVEIWALEIRQYVSQSGLKTLVPRIVGKTAEAQLKKSNATGERRRWDETSFFNELQVRLGADEANTARHIHDWVKQQAALDIQWGTGDIYGGFTAIVNQKYRKPHKLFAVDISGRLEISSNKYGTQAPFDQEEKWLELRNKLSSIGLSLPFDKTEFRYPVANLSGLQDEQTLGKVLATFDWVVGEIQAI